MSNTYQLPIFKDPDSVQLQCFHGRETATMDPPESKGSEHSQGEDSHPSMHRSPRSEELLQTSEILNESLTQQHNDDYRYKRKKKHKRQHSRRHLPPVRVGDASTEEFNSTRRSHVEGYDNHAYEEHPHSQRVRKRSSLEEKHRREYKKDKDKRERDEGYDVDKDRQPVVEDVIVAEKVEDVQAGLNVLKEISEQDWHNEIARFVKDKEIKQRTGPKDGDLENANSFGEIEFIGFGQNNKTAPYIRVDKNTKPEILWELMTKHWKMPLPKVLISVTGGAQDFFFKGRLKNLFNKGLFKAAVSTGAWIITGGTAVGVMKKVGEAINEESQGTTDERIKNVVALGIATWNVIVNNQALTHPNKDGYGLWPARYLEKDLIHHKKFTALDSNHTHFILVDHGKEEYGADIGLRASLEQFIHTDTKAMGNTDPNKRLHVPVVLVVVEGGYGTIETVYKSLVPKEKSKKSVPVVIVEGSGRAADIISEALRKTKQSKKPKEILEVLEGMDSLKSEIKDEDKLKKCIGWLKKIMEPQYRAMITVFHMQENNFKDIDRAILHGLLQAESLSNDIQVQMNLALKWNRSDIAREEIITAERRDKWKNVELEENMMAALIDNKVEFVELFLQHVIHLDKFLTVPRLYDLYKKVIYCDWSIDGRSTTKDILKARLDKLTHKNDVHQEYLLRNVGRMVHKLTLHESDRIYVEEKYIVRSKNDQFAFNVEKNPDTKDEHDFKCPAQHLFLWAVLLNRRAMAKLFWKRISVGSIGSALIAGRILKALSEHAKIEEELTLYSDLCDHADEFESLAVGVLESCYESDKRMSKLALVRKLTAWGGSTCLSVAYAADQMKFIEHDCCQTKLQRVWKGNVQIHSVPQWIGFLIATMFPFIIPGMTFLAKDYKQGLLKINEDDKSRDEKREEQSKEEKQKLPLYQRVKNCLFRWDSKYSCERQCEIRRIGGEEDDVTLWEGLGYFYKAPVTKFYYGVIMYIVLLILFSIFILTDLRPADQPNSPGWIEIVVIAWVGTLLIEECRQIIVKEPKSIWYKIWSWGSDAWNLFDLAMFSLFITSVILRFTLKSESFAAARVIYCITLMFFYFRLLHMGFVQKDIGPKIIMISKMLRDLVYFIVILVIFILSFGIANEALLYPNMQRNPLVIFKSVYKPYWQLYGELFLEEIEGLVENETCYEDPRYMDTCPHTDDSIKWVPPTLTAIYMLISNILLINLLIAMFSNTFQKVQDNSETIWRFYRYELICEYNDRPTLAPPLIIINHVHRIIKHCYQKIKLWNSLRKASKMDKKDEERAKILKEFEMNQSHTLQVKLDDRLEDYLNVFERQHMNNYFIKRNQEYVTSWQSTVSSNGERLQQVIHEIEEIKESVGISSRPDANISKQAVPPTTLNQTWSFSQGDSRPPHHMGYPPPPPISENVKADVSEVRSQFHKLNSRVLGLEAKIDRVLKLLEHSPITDSQ
ncbi:transient receptor potential cation channel subfamily M member 5-like [Ptychodera flava]|uniref:transient receptor potential cation channel subfamily M member 5-like n=1 Tax=Ptychodera flava TaxID=63121 RepID=UPI00396A5E1F